MSSLPGRKEFGRNDAEQGSSEVLRGVGKEKNGLEVSCADLSAMGVSLIPVRMGVLAPYCFSVLSTSRCVGAG